MSDFVSRFPLAYETWKLIEQEETITGKIEVLDAARHEAEERARREENEGWQKIVKHGMRYEEINGREQCLAILKHGRARMEGK